MEAGPAWSQGRWARAAVSRDRGRALVGPGLRQNCSFYRMHALPTSPLVQACIVQTADLVHRPYKRQGAGGIPDSHVRGGHLQLL